MWKVAKTRTCTLNWGYILFYCIPKVKDSEKHVKDKHSKLLFQKLEPEFNEHTPPQIVLRIYSNQLNDMKIR
jgi:hypothetical protein